MPYVIVEFREYQCLITDVLMLITCEPLMIRLIPSIVESSGDWHTKKSE